MCKNVRTHAHKSTVLSKIKGIIVSNAPHLSLIVNFSIVHCHYFVGALQGAADHNLALGRAASGIIIKQGKKIEASVSDHRSFLFDMNQIAESVWIIL